MSKYVIARADFGGNTRYVKKFNMTYDINEADRFDTIEDAKDALRHHILTRVDFNLSVGTLNKIMSHYNIIEIKEDINNINLQEATMLALEGKLDTPKKGKLTATQQQVYDEICQYLNKSKQCKNVEEFFAMDKGEIPEWRSWKHQSKSTKEFYTYLYNSAINENIALVTASSSTLRALEKKGYIQIVEDGKRYPDMVKLL